MCDTNRGACEAYLGLLVASVFLQTIECILGVKLISF